MALLIKSNKIRFGDLNKGDTMYFIHPHFQKVEPAYILGTDVVFQKPNLKKFVVLLIPEEDRNQPIANLDTSKMRQVIFNVEETASMCIVLTNPCTAYCTSEQELKTWMKFTG